MTRENFEVGNVVRLKGHNVKMIVTAIEPPFHVTCFWYSDNAEGNSHELPRRLLVKVSDQLEDHDDC